MLRITIKRGGEELFDEATNHFSHVGETITIVDLEHSLVSLSKWESIHQIPFLSSSGELSPEQIFDYLKCMVVTSDVDPNVLIDCTQEDLDSIQTYINSGESATTFGPMPERRGGANEKVTSELIYYWMVAYKIPFEAERWHLNRLLSLIKICNVKNSKPKKRSPQEVRAERSRMNAERRAKYGTRG